MKPVSALLLLALAPCFAGAEETPVATATPAPAAKAAKLGLHLIGYGAYQAPADLSGDASGTVQRTVWDGEIAYSGEVDEDTTLDLDYEAKWTHSRFSATAPYGDTESHFMGAHTVHMFDRSWGVGAVGAVELASETAADLMGDGLRGGAGTSLVWKASDTLSTETGVSVQTQFGQKATPSPYLRWKWLAAENLELELRATGLQNGVVGTWFLTDNRATSVRVSLFYENSQYALRRSAEADGVAIREAPLRVVLTQFLNESFFVALRGEWTLFRREGFYRDNEKIGTLRSAPAPGIGLMAGLRL